MSESRYSAWRKSSHSDGTGNCVEVMGAECIIAVRDAKQEDGGPILGFTVVAWRRFIAETKNDKLSL